jgi:hypothetical protein
MIEPIGYMSNTMVYNATECIVITTGMNEEYTITLFVLAIIVLFFAFVTIYYDGLSKKYKTFIRKEKLFQKFEDWLQSRKIDSE